MKKIYLIIIGLFIGMSAVQAQEAEPNTLVVNTIDGKSYRFTLMTDVKQISFDKEFMQFQIFSPSDFEMLTLHRDKVKDLTFEADPNDVESIVSGKTVSFRIVNKGIIVVEGLKAGDQLLVVKADGRTVMNAKAPNGGHVKIDLSQQTAGLYIVSVNKSFTFKVTKP